MKPERNDTKTSSEAAMSETEIIQVEYEAIKKFCRGDKHLALRITSELGEVMRTYIRIRKPQRVSPDELCSVLENATKTWQLVH